jgi:hypothetical protein
MKYLVVGIVVVAAVGAGWLGWSKVKGHHDRVTLHVRNVPVADVVKRLERQTGEKIITDSKLDGLVTLDIKDKPLSAVLDRLGEQCGANWTTVYAVHDSHSSLSALESALYGGKKLEETGWKTIAPAGLGSPGELPLDLAHLDKMPGTTTTIITNGNFAGAHGGTPVRMMVRRNGTNSTTLSKEDIDQMVNAAAGGNLPPGATLATEDVVAVGPGSNRVGGVNVQRRTGPAVVRVVRKKGDGGATSIQEEVWSPVEIVLESRLEPQLGEFNEAPTPEAAAQAAKKLNGSVKTYYALRKSALAGLAGMSFDLGKMRGGQSFTATKGTGVAGTNVAEHLANAGPSSEDLEKAMRGRRLDELGKLTPEQRVQRARDKQAATQQ